MSKFKVGDKVRVVRAWKSDIVNEGDIVEVTDNDWTGFLPLEVKNKHGTRSRLNANQVEPIGFGFTKADLKTGDKVELRDGRIGTILKGTGLNSTDMVKLDKYMQVDLCQYDESMRAMTPFRYRELDVVKVYRPLFSESFDSLYSIGDYKSYRLQWESADDLVKIKLGDKVAIVSMKGEITKTSVFKEGYVGKVTNMLAETASLDNKAGGWVDIEDINLV